MFMANHFKHQRNCNHNLILFILVIHTLLNSNSVFLFQVGDQFTWVFIKDSFGKVKKTFLKYR